MTSLNARRIMSTAVVFLSVALAGCESDGTAPPLSPDALSGDRLAGSGLSRFEIWPMADEGGAAVPMAALGASSSGLEYRGLERYPAETRQWEAIVNDSAYYRDVEVRMTSELMATDGDRFEAYLVYPDGYRELLWDLRYYDSLDGQNACWVEGGWRQCEWGSWMGIRSYLGMQCAMTGSYRFELRYNDVVVEEPRLQMVPRIPPSAYETYVQLDYSETYDDRCINPAGGRTSVACVDYPEATPYAISQLGCALTSLAVVSSYFGAPVEPPALSGWMLENRAFSGSSVHWDASARWAYATMDTIFRSRGFAEYSGVRDRICRYGPQIVEVRTDRNTQHFAVAVGMTDDETDVMIHDPGTRAAGPHELTPKYVPRALRLYEGPERVDTLAFLNEEDNLIVSFHSPGDIMITDPVGRRVGADPGAGVTFAEVPNAFHEVWEVGVLESDGLFSDRYDAPVRRINIQHAMDGDYQIQVTGTGDGTYDLRITRSDMASADRAEVHDVPIRSGEIHRYTVPFDGSAVGTGDPLRLAGGFAGGGQRSDVDALLRYARPADRSTALAAGTTNYTLMISYGEAVVPATFYAELNRRDVSGFFSPSAGVTETVVLPLAAGRNVLLLAVDGHVGGRVATDRDRLTFIVP